MNKKLLAAASLSVLLSGGLLTQASNAVQNSDALPTTLTATSDPVKADTSAERVNKQVFVPEKGVTGEQKYIVRFDEEPLATYAGNLPGLTATGANLQKSSGNRNASRLNAKSQASQAYMGHLKQQQAHMESSMNRLLGRQLDIRKRYQAALNGMTVRMTQDEAAALSNLPGIAKIQRDRVEYLTTDRGPTYIEAPYLWQGDANGIAAKGEGIVIAIMDSGINGDHPSFAGVSDDGYVHVNPLGEGNYLGICDPAFADFDPAVECNSKLIGRYSFLDANSSSGNSEDLDGHGTHVASTAGGNPISAPVLDAEGKSIGLDIEISGVAPRANIIALEVCGDDGCFTSDRIAALDQIIADGVVDVINHSIGSNVPVNISPWEDAMSLAWLSARAAGITVANSSGNNGPDAATLGGSGAPWVTNSGAFTHDRDIQTKFLESLSGGTGVIPADIEGRSLTGAYGPAAIVFAGDFSNGDVDPEQCLNPFPAGTWNNGEIVMCERGSIARVDKCKNVRDGGAAGCILANVPGGAASLDNDTHVIPAIHVDSDAGAQLKTWLAAGTGHTGSITSALDTIGVDPANGAVAADFTSRGPNLSQDYLPISVGSPGVDIYAALNNGVEYGFLSGTSMASPHTAGASALMKQVHPDWTDAEILSALATTANFTGAKKEDGTSPADPFEVGGGVILLSKAATAGLLLDETVANFEAADPNLGGDPKTLNVAGMVTRACVIECTWTRTFEATTAGSWTVSTTSSNVVVTPSSFTLNAGEMQTVTVTVDATGLQADWFHDLVVLTPSGDLPEQHLTVSYVPSTGELPELIEVVAHRDADSYLIEGLSAAAITDLQATVAGLTAPSVTALSLAGDTDNSSPYDDLTDGVFFTTLTLDDTATRIVASTADETSESPDVDIYVGYDLNGDGLPGATEVACISATATAAETCDLTGVFAGTWWVLVQNWQSSDAAPDAIELSTTVVAGDAGNSAATGPTTVPQLEEFDIRYFWDLDDVEVGDTLYGTITLGSNVGKADDIGTIPVTIVRGQDDVSFSASTDVAAVGDSVSFLAEVIPNLSSEDRTYEVSAKIPAGMSVVDGTVSAGGVVDGDTIVWTVAMPSLAGAEPSYDVVTSEEDAACAMPFANSGAYTNLEAFGIFPDTTVTGDTVVFSAFANQNFNFYGRSFVGGLSFTDDGFIYFNSTQGSSPWVNTPIPTNTDPNDMIAMLWRDMVIPTPSATPGEVVGVSLASAGPDLTILEFDGMKLFPGDGDDSIDFGVAIAGVSDDTPGVYEIMVAFDNVNVDSTVGTIGVENQTGTVGTQFMFNNVAVTNGLAVCYDLVQPVFETAVLSFEAVVDDGSAGVELPVSLTSTVSVPGTEAVTETQVIAVEGAVSSTFTGRFVGPLIEDPDLDRGERIQARFLLFDDGTRVIDPEVRFSILKSDGSVLTEKRAQKLRSKKIYYRNMVSGWIRPGSYTFQATVDGEIIDQVPFTIN